MNLKNNKIVIIISILLTVIIISSGCIEVKRLEEQTDETDDNNNGDDGDDGGDGDNGVNGNNSDNGANAKNDRDGDGVIDSEDDFPNDPNEWQDSDGDGYGDNSDEFPFNANEWVDSDGDGIGDNSDEYPEDPYSLYNGSDVWELNDEIILTRQDIKGSFEFVSIQNEIDYLVWNISCDQEVDLLIIDPSSDHVYHEVGTEHEGKYTVDVAGTWEIQLVYNGLIPPITIVNGIGYQII